MSDPKRIKLQLDGNTYEIDVDDDETVLEAALREDIDAPYSCMSGTCTACVAKLNSGTVTMDECYALTEDEVEQGQVLTCQAHPTSADVELIYPE